MLAGDGSVIVMEPQTGKILALCNVPNFDLNNYSQVESSDIYTNKIVSEAYEPGSVFKPFTMATAIELGKVTPETKFNDEGFLKFGPDTIRNAASKKYGEITMIQALENSVNTALANVGLKVGRKNLKDYAEKFGFGKKTGITLPAESSGNINALNFKGEVYTATASYGQGVMTTLLQLASAYSVIANDGILMQPQIVSEIIDSKGNIKKLEPQKVRRAITSKTANIIKAMLVSVVKNGQAKKAGVDGYYVAGKTGTANIANPKGGYLENVVNHTFAGFAPVNNPKFVIIIKLSKPKNVKFSSDSATPAFGELAEYLLKYYQVPPDF
jgi:cell division protein FtsI/penicillin-binding protein 2